MTNRSGVTTVFVGKLSEVRVGTSEEGDVTSCCQADVTCVSDETSSLGAISAGEGATVSNLNIVIIPVSGTAIESVPSKGCIRVGSCRDCDVSAVISVRVQSPVTNLGIGIVIGTWVEASSQKIRFIAGSD